MLHRSWRTFLTVTIFAETLVTFELHWWMLINYPLSLSLSSALMTTTPLEEPPIELGLNGSVSFPPTNPIAKIPAGLPRTLLFVTTHMSTHHEAPLKFCWPTAMRRSHLLNSSGVVVHFVRNELEAIAANETDVAIIERVANAARDRREHGFKAIRLLRRAFRHQNLTIHARPNIGYQEGAASAVIDAAHRGWWDGYDWVVRVNPDVIIGDENPLLRAMTGGDNNAAGVFVNCLSNPTNKRHLVHTDFFAVKVSAVAGSHSLARTARTAEDQWTNVVRGPIIDKGRAVWLEGSRPKKMVCRSAQGRSMEGALVVHIHMPLENETCTVPFD